MLKTSLEEEAMTIGFVDDLALIILADDKHTLIININEKLKKRFKNG